MILYDRGGTPLAYSEDDECIYLFSGKPVAFFKSDTIYIFSGKQLGRFNDGWVRDIKGQCVFFTENASCSGPIKPIKSITPIKGVKGIKPVKPITSVPSVKAVDSLSWSELSGMVFFQ